MVFDNRSDKFLKSEFLNGKEKRRKREKRISLIYKNLIELQFE